MVGEDYKLEHYNNIKLMQSHKKPHKSPEHNTTTYKSPYFSSVHRSRQSNQNNNNKNRITASAQNALHITKYPSLNNANENVAYFGTGAQDNNKKKVFKRFNKFQQIDQVYGYEVSFDKKLNQRKDKQASTHTNSREYTSANPKAILYSNKTLALMQKYSSYKSILLSTPKIQKMRSKSKQGKESREHSLSIRRNSNFRTKIKSGNTIQWSNSGNNIGAKASGVEVEDCVDKMSDLDRAPKAQENQDWLCQQLIRNQVYGVDQDDF